MTLYDDCLIKSELIMGTIGKNYIRAAKLCDKNCHPLDTPPS